MPNAPPLAEIDEQALVVDDDGAVMLVALESDAFVVVDVPEVLLLAGGDGAETLVVDLATDAPLLAVGDDDVLLISQGEPGPRGVAGSGGGGDYLEFAFAAALSVLIAHNFGRRPAVQVLSPGSLRVSADVAHLDANLVRLNFNLPLAGLAILTA